MDNLTWNNSTNFGWIFGNFNKEMPQTLHQAPNYNLGAADEVVTQNVAAEASSAPSTSSGFDYKRISKSVFELGGRLSNSDVTFQGASRNSIFSFFN